MYLQHILQQKAVPTGGKWFFERRMAGHRHKKEVRTCCSTTQTKLLATKSSPCSVFFFLNLAGTQGWPERRRLNWGWVWVRTTSRLLSRIHSLGSWYWCSSCFSQLEMGNCGRCSVASLQKTQRFYTTKRTTWISIDLFWNQICPIFLLKVSTLKKTSFSNFLGLIWRGTQ
jgi:hypothetical protein